MAPQSERRTRPRLLTLEDRLTPAGVTPVFAADRLLVAFAEVVPDAVRRAELHSVPGVEGVRPIGFGMYAVDLRAGAPLDVVQSKLARLSGVLSAAPDAKVLPNRVPNDPSFGGQGWLSALGAPAAWEVTTGTGATVVAVIDTGVDTSHPDLAANIWVNMSEVAGNGLDDDADGYVDDVHGVDFTTNGGNPADADGHGTHVAGVVGAAGGNGLGGSGINWHATIMPLKFMGPDGGFTSDAVRAMDYAVRHGAKVLNNSWGGGNYDPTLATAIVRARNSGAVVVTSAGNYASDNDAAPFYPAGYVTQSDNVVAVAAANASGGLSSYSNFGATTVTLAAPGDNVLSTLPGGRQGVLSGTSMAAPMVSGALSLLWDRHPDWNYQQVLAKLRGSVDVNPGLVGKTVTGGRLNLAKLLDAPTGPPPAPVPPPSVTPPTPGDVTGPRVVRAVFGGARAGQFDRAVVVFSEPVNAATLTSGALTLTGPAGALGLSAVIPVAGSNATQFTLMFSRNQTASGAYALGVAPSVRDLAGNPLDQDGDGVGGQATDRYATSATLGTPATPPVSPPATPPVNPPPPAAARSYSAGVPRAIGDRRTTRVEIYVADVFAVSDLAVNLDITHGRASDLNIRLTSPDGRRVVLFNRRGGQSAHLNGTSFRDLAATNIASAAAPFAGTFRPEQPLGALDGMAAKGVWVFEIFDLAGGATGTLNRATLGFGA